MSAIRFLLLSVGLLLVAACAAPDTVSPVTLAPTTPRNREVTIWSYYVGALEMATLLANQEVIGEVNPFWYELTGDGSIRGSVQNGAGLDKLQKAGIRVLPSIMNSFSAGRVHNVVSDPDRRRQHIADIVTLVLENNFDGIDIDYESLDPQDRDDFSLFIEELADALHGEDKLLSIAVHPKASDEGSWEGPAAQDWARLGAVVDEFKIMTYDYHWSTSDAGPIAPVEWANQVIDYAAAVVPPQKTYLGVHFYGYDWLGKNAKPLTWMEVQTLIQRHAAQVQRDESNEGWFTYDAGAPSTVYFADALSVETKVSEIFARHPELAGISIWRLGSEDPDNWRVIRAWAEGDE